MEILLLHLLAKGPRHGYDLISDIQALAGAQYTPSGGALYPVLRKLAESGMVTVVTQDGSRKHIYELTPLGSERLQKAPDAVERVLTRITALLPEPSADLGARIRQAYAELGAAVDENADDIPQSSGLQIISKLSSLTQLLSRLGAKAKRQIGTHS